MHQIKKLWYFLSSHRKKQFGLLIILMIMASLSEIVSVGSVIPFISVLASPERIYQHELMQPMIQFLEITEPSQLLMPLTMVFISAVLLSGVIRLTLLYVTTRLSFAVGADLSIDIYRKTLYQDYKVHVARNSSEVINGIITKTGTVIGGVVSPSLNLISSTVMAVAILITLFAIDAEVALIASIGIGVIYLGVIRYTRKQLKENSKCIADQSTQMIKSLQEGLGGIRDVLLDGSQQFYCQLYRNADLPLRKASGNNTFIGQSPRYFMEAFGMILIAAIAYVMSLRENDLAMVLPILGALALGAQRLLPVLQQAYASYTAIKGSQSSFYDVLNLLEQPLPSYIGQPLSHPIQFEKNICLKGVGFRYGKDTPWVLKNIDLSFVKGSRIGFIGVTGSGKSTLLDIIMGLLPPTVGTFTVDSQPIENNSIRSWQMHVAHVPQNIYLSDSSIEENIAFGIPKNLINHELVREAAKQAQLSELIEKWQEGYNTFVGECGVRLSGGQRQRIAIARALYREANILVLDEATSALDNDTEKAVMNAIENLGREVTVLTIAHRISTLRGCDLIVELGEGEIIHVGSFQDVLGDRH